MEACGRQSLSDFRLLLPSRRMNQRQEAGRALWRDELDGGEGIAAGPGVAQLLWRLWQLQLAGRQPAGTAVSMRMTVVVTGLAARDGMMVIGKVDGDGQCRLLGGLGRGSWRHVCRRIQRPGWVIQMVAHMTGMAAEAPQFITQALTCRKHGIEGYGQDQQQGQQGTHARMLT